MVARQLCVANDSASGGRLPTADSAAPGVLWLVRKVRCLHVHRLCASCGRRGKTLPGYAGSCATRAMGSTTYVSVHHDVMPQAPKDAMKQASICALLAAASPAF